MWKNFKYTQNKQNNKLIFIHYPTSATTNILPFLFHLNRPLPTTQLDCYFNPHLSIRHWTFLSLQETPLGLFPVEHQHFPQPKSWTIVQYYVHRILALPVLELNVNGIIPYCVQHLSLDVYVRVIHIILQAYTFLFITEWYSIIGIYQNFLTHYPINWYLGCFQLLAIMNKCTLKILEKVIFWTYVFICLGKTPRSRAARSKDRCND